MIYLLLSIPLWVLVFIVWRYSKRRQRFLEQEHAENVKDIARMTRQMQDWFQP